MTARRDRLGWLSLDPAQLAWVAVTRAFNLIVPTCRGHIHLGQLAAQAGKVRNRGEWQDPASIVALLDRSKEEASSEGGHYLRVERWPHFNNLAFQK